MQTVALVDYHLLQFWFTYFESQVLTKSPKACIPEDRETTNTTVAKLKSCFQDWKNIYIESSVLPVPIASFNQMNYIKALFKVWVKRKQFQHSTNMKDYHSRLHSEKLRVIVHFENPPFTKISYLRRSEHCIIY